MRVAFLIDRWDSGRGGAERQLAALARHLERRGCEVLACAESAAPGAPGTVRTVRTRPAWSRGAHALRLSAALTAAAAEARADVTIGIRHLERVDLYWPHGGLHVQGVAASRAARAWRPGRAPGIPPLELPRFHRAFAALEGELLARGQARRVACVSELVRAELAAAYPGCAPRCAVVGAGIDLERWRPERREREFGALRRALAPRGEVLIAFAARNPVLKGLPVLLAALRLLDGLPWRLAIAGPRDPARWLRRARRWGLPGGSVECVDAGLAEGLLHAADVLALPTWRDTFGLVVAEALACGTPVVVTRCAGAAELVRGDAGEIVERPGDTDALADALQRQIERAEERAIDRAALRERVLHLGEPAWLARLEGLVRELAP